MSLPECPHDGHAFKYQKFSQNPCEKYPADEDIIPTVDTPHLPSWIRSMELPFVPFEFTPPVPYGSTHNPGRCRRNVVAASTTSR